MQYALWLSPERSHREVRLDTELRTADTEYKAYKSRLEVFNFVQFNGDWVPQKWMKMNWMINQQGQIAWTGLTCYELNQIKNLASEQRSIYSVDFPLGVSISDNVRKSDYVEGVDFMPYLDTLNEKTFSKEVEDFITRVVTEETAKNTAVKAVKAPQ